MIGVGSTQVNSMSEKIIKYADAGKRLLDDADYKLLVEEYEKELAKTWNELAETPTTDPRIAQLQAKKQTLEWAIGRAPEWVRRRIEYIKSKNMPEVTPSEDYDAG